MIELWKCFCRSKETLLGLFKISVGQKLHDLLQYWTIKSSRHWLLLWTVWTVTLKRPFFVLRSLGSLAVAVIGFYLYFQSWLLRRGVKSSPRSCDFLCDAKTISLPGQETKRDMDVELTHSPWSTRFISLNNSIKVVCYPKLQLIFVSLFVDDCIIRKWETIWSRHS